MDGYCFQMLYLFFFGSRKLIEPKQVTGCKNRCHRFKRWHLFFQLTAATFLSRLFFSVKPDGINIAHYLFIARNVERFVVHRYRII